MGSSSTCKFLIATLWEEMEVYLGTTEILALYEQRSSRGVDRSGVGWGGVSGTGSYLGWTLTVSGIAATRLMKDVLAVKRRGHRVLPLSAVCVSDMEIQCNFCSFSYSAQS